MADIQLVMITITYQGNGAAHSVLGLPKVLQDIPAGQTAPSKFTVKAVISDNSRLCYIDR